MMKYNFDEIIERRGTDCVKHDRIEAIFKHDDLLPMWVADMDFRAPQCVMEAIRKRAEHEVLGYTFASQHYLQCVRQWLKKHYSIEARDNELHFIPGIVAGISFAIQSLLSPNDGILLLTPVYPPFINLPRYSQHPLHYSKLNIEDGQFGIDFDDMEQQAKGCKMLILANPHNPGGRVWSKEELSRIAEICEKNNMIVVDDEIHADLTLPGYHHTAYPTVSDIAANHCLTFYAPSKTFNIAGLSSSICYIHNEELRNKFYGYLDGYELANGNIFAFVGAEAAYTYGEEWLQEVLVYLANNKQYLKEFVDSRLPKLKVVLPEASYLAWIDFSNYGLPHAETKRRLLEVAKVAMNNGVNFGGEAYENCFRLNIGCPRATLNKALERIERAFGK